MNQWRDEWKNGVDEWTVGEGKAVVLCGISLAPPSLFCSSFLSPCLLIGWEESMLLEGTAVMWGLPPFPLPITTSAVYEWKLEKLNEELGCMRASCVCSAIVVLKWENLSCFGFMNAFSMHAIYT